ncbi:MAG TPA: hypothetical protein VH482_15900 [Thermomicrobiales bacterium]|jgi:hypothetical protein
MIATPVSIAADTASRLAAAYDRCLAAIDDDGIPDPFCLRFAAWLANRWRPDGSPEPRLRPDAISPDGVGAHRVRWYADAAAVRGFVPGTRGCYLVPLDDPVPAA